MIIVTVVALIFLSKKKSTMKISGMSIFWEYAEKNWNQIRYSGSFSSSNLKVSSVPRNTKKLTTLPQFVNTPADSSERKVPRENRIFRWGSCFFQGLSVFFTSAVAHCMFPTNFFGEGKRRNEFAEWRVAWLTEWHNYAECNMQNDLKK